MENSISWKFGELEAVLASVHFIDESKRTAFQARLKNFHRLRFPLGFSAIKGKAATYSPYQIVDMALAVEMTQLGLPPERAIWVLTSNLWPTLMAIQMAARTLEANPNGFFELEAEEDKPLSMFLFFDPAALNSLTLNLPADVVPDLDQASNSFFYGGIGIVRENIGKWTQGSVARLSMINLTAMIDNVAASPFKPKSVEDLAYRVNFFRQLCCEAEGKQEEWEGGSDGEADHAHGLLEREGIMDAHILAERLGIPESRAITYVLEELSRKDRR